MLAATAAVDGVSKSAWLVVADGLVAWTPTFLVRDTIHKPVRVHLLPEITSEVENKMILMGHQILSCHAPVVSHLRAFPR
jgi:hypothetical protein